MLCVSRRWSLGSGRSNTFKVSAASYGAGSVRFGVNGCWLVFRQPVALRALFNTPPTDLTFTANRPVGADHFAGRLRVAIIL